MRERSSPEIAAIDVGFHSTKGKRRNTECSFESIAPLLGTDQDLTGGLATNDIRVVEVNGSKFAVGCDSLLYASSNQSKNFNENYVQSDQYKALVYGMLSYLEYCDGDTIDLLVMGLPPNRLNQSKALEQLFTGAFQITEDTHIVIKNVWVLPQPMGTLYNDLITPQMTQSQFLILLRQDSDRRRIILDCGFGTIGWLTTIGMKPMPNQSGAEHIGGGNVIAKVALRLSTLASGRNSAAKLNFSVADYTTIERKIRNDHFSFKGINFSREELEPTILNSTTEYVNQVLNAIDDRSLVDEYTVTGGCSPLFYPAFKESLAVSSDLLPKPIESSRWRNPRGFYKAGVLLFDQILAKKRAA